MTNSTTVQSGSEVTIEAVPSANHRFVKWTDDNSTTNPRTITVTSDLTITANFIRQWKVSAGLASGSEGMGTIKIDNAAATEKMVDNGGSVTLQAVAKTGNEFVKWIDGSGKDLSTSNPYTISNIRSDKSAKAVFLSKEKRGEENDTEFKNGDNNW